jgi:hypothetical protein
MYEGWQQRVIEECDELDARGKKLFDFIESERFTKLPRFDQIALCMQFAHMQGYMTILRRRVAAF